MTRLLLAVGLTVIVGAATVTGTGEAGLAQHQEHRLKTEVTGGNPVPGAHRGTPVTSGEPSDRALVAAAPLPPETQLSDGGAVVGGLASFVAASYGSRYLALPGGPGIRVTICAKRCVTRTSTDAGPSKAMQRQGRVADLSFADFAYVCRCSPEAVGLIVVSVQYDELPRTDTR